MPDFTPTSPMRPTRPSGARVRLEVVEALAFLTLASVAVPLVPYGRIRRYLGAFPRETPRELQEADERRALRVRSRIRTVCRSLGWKPRCLARALAATAMLRRRGLASTTYLGVRPGARPVRGHAWVRCGRVYVVGGVSQHRYETLGGFSRGG